MSPGMKAKIKSGQYTFPSPEWDCVSEAGQWLSSRITQDPFPAKDLIRNLLKTDPAERYTIDQTMSHKWITHFNKARLPPAQNLKFLQVPDTPLFTSAVLLDQKAQWGDMQVGRHPFWDTVTN